MDQGSSPERVEAKREITFKEVDLKNWTEIDIILKESGVISNFTCIPQLFAFAVKENDHLYIAYINGSPRLILCRQRKTPEGIPVKDVRILFCRDDNDEDLISAIKNQFSPDYLAYNLIPQKKLPADCLESSERHELIIDLETVANLKIKNLERDHRRCQRRHPQLRYVKAKPEDKEAIIQFLDEWCQTAGRKLEENPKAENDRRFIEMFLSDSRVNGGLVFDGSKIIGIAFHTYHPSDKGKLAVKVILKNLRGYTKLGQWLMVEEAKQLLSEGFSQALMGGDEIPSQAKFKEQFMAGGQRKVYFSYKIFSNPQLNFPADFLSNIWR